MKVLLSDLKRTIDHLSVPKYPGQMIKVPVLTYDTPNVNRCDVAVSELVTLPIITVTAEFYSRGKSPKRLEWVMKI